MGWHSFFVVTDEQNGARRLAPIPRWNMKILQRVWILGLVLIVSAQGLFAQGDTKVKFDTVDGVTIRGNLYISAKGKSHPRF